VNEPTAVPPALRFTIASNSAAVHWAKVEKTMVWVAVPFGAMFDDWTSGSIAGQPAGIPVTPGAVKRPNQVPEIDTALLVQFWTVRVAVERPPGLTVEGLKVKLVTWTVPVQAAGAAANVVLAVATVPPITTDVIAAAVRSTPTSLRICDSSSTPSRRRGMAGFPAYWLVGRRLPNERCRFDEALCVYNVASCKFRMERFQFASRYGI
jgi:hypothetical protein